LKYSKNQSKQKIELNETIKNLQKSVQNMQTSIVKLEQTADQLNLTLKTLNPNQLSSIKQEIQVLKGLFLGRSRQSKISEVYQFFYSKLNIIFFFQ
jgi:exonuclease VII small subunit